MYTRAKFPLFSNDFIDKNLTVWTFADNLNLSQYLLLVELNLSTMRILMGDNNLISMYI